MQIDRDRIPALIHLGRLPVRAPAGREVDAWLVRYARSDFDLAAFDASGIPCPPQVARSVPRRQAEYLFGRLAARQALQALGATTLDVPSGSHREPVWPAGIVGSITHTGVFAAALVLRREQMTAVGLDLESVATGSSLEALLKTVVDAEELALLRGLEPALSQATGVTLAFSAKESFFKAAFAEVGRYFDFPAVRVRAVDMARGHLTLEVMEPLSDGLAPGAIRVVTFGFVDEKTLFTACLW